MKKEAVFPPLFFKEMGSKIHQLTASTRLCRPCAIGSFDGYGFYTVSIVAHQRNS
jgi:hypothetical protein